MTLSNALFRRRRHVKHLANAPAPWRAHVSGQQLLQPDGTPFSARGSNQGNWGETKSYDAAWLTSHHANTTRRLIRIAGVYNDPSIDAWSLTSPGYFDPAHLAQFLDEIQADQAAGQKTIVAIDSNGIINGGIQDSNGDGGAAAFAYMMNGTKFPFDPAYPSSGFSIAAGGRNFLTDPPLGARFIAAWQYLVQQIEARRFTNILLYEFAPEPLIGFPDSAIPGLIAYFRAGLAAIDSVMTVKTPYLVGGRGYDCSLVDDVYMAERTDCVYTGDGFVHLVDPNNPSSGPDTTQWRGKVNALVSAAAVANVPILMQQVGVQTGTDDSSHTGLHYIVTTLNSLGIAATQWSLRQNPDSAAAGAFTQYGLIVTDHTTGADIFKTDEIAIWDTYWAGGTAPVVT